MHSINISYCYFPNLFLGRTCSSDFKVEFLSFNTQFYRWERTLNICETNLLLLSKSSVHWQQLRQLKFETNHLYGSNPRLFHGNSKRAGTSDWICETTQVEAPSHLCLETVPPQSHFLGVGLQWTLWYHTLRNLHRLGWSLHNMNLSIGP